VNILVVGDKDYEREPIAQAVRELGHTVREDRDGSHAWERYCRTHFDVVISDYLMPDMDGFELCRRVRLSPHQDYTYFIIVSSRSEAENLLAGFKAGVDDYLPKPVSPVELECRLISARRVTQMHRELAESNAQLLHLSDELKAESRRDALTGIGNRLRFQDDLQRMLDETRRYDHRFFLGLCDIDNFKKYNDTYGHLEGDKVLKSVARALSLDSRSSDGSYRFGGEEFLVVFAEQDLPGAKTAAERLRKAVESLQIVHEKNPPHSLVTVSIGLAAFKATEANMVDGCLQRADEALYWSKDTGRNRISAWSEMAEPQESSSKPAFKASS
jgi:two-component system chemotaxis response regulator CheY